MAKGILQQLGIKTVIDGGTWQSVNQAIASNQ
jgi:hypothetical protein